MTVTLAYVLPLNVWDRYQSWVKRFVQTYRDFPPGIEHSLAAIVSPYIIPDHPGLRMLADIVTRFEPFSGIGWDIGGYLHASTVCNSDFMVCAGTRVHFTKAGWLARIVEARERCGDGFYASTDTFEQCANLNRLFPNPHLRTTFFGCNPKVLRTFPHRVTNREECYRFECGDWCVSRWFDGLGLPVKMVTWDGIYGKEDWRKPANIYRRGDQSNLIARDGWTDEYDHASPERRAELERITG